MTKRSNTIAVTDTDALNEHINNIRGNASTWTFGAADVQRIAEQAEKRLERMFLPPTHRRGVVVTARSPGPSAGAYKYSVTGSAITLRRAKDGWRLAGYERRYAYPRDAEKIDIQISPVQAAKSAEAMLRQTRVTVVAPIKKATA